MLLICPFQWVELEPVRLKTTFEEEASSSVLGTAIIDPVTRAGPSADLEGSNAAHRAFSKRFSSKRSFPRLSSMCPSIMRSHGAKAANSAGRTFERPRASPNSLTNPAIHNNPVIKPELVEFA